MNAYDELAASALMQIERAADVVALDGLRPGILGKKAPLTEAKKELGSLEPDERKNAGQALNAARASVESASKSSESRRVNR